MTEKRLGEELFYAWRAGAPPAYDKQAGRTRFLERFAAGQERSGRRHFVVAAAAAMACAIAMAWWWRAPSTLSFATATGKGEAGAWLATSNADELPLTFSEGTRVVMAPGSRGRVEDLGRAGASFLLERGKVQARVMRRAGASWHFLAGPFEVQVTGTELVVDWDPLRERFAVRVDQGTVVVRGPNVGAPQVVRTGEQCVVDLPSRTTHISPIDQDGPEDSDLRVDAGRNVSAAAVSTSSASPAAAQRYPMRAAPVSWFELEEKGDYEAAYAAASSAGLASVLRASSADQLLRLAQVARLSGHRDTEREALVTCRRRFAGSERAAVAAYELGRSSSPREASSWFETYLSEQSSGSLAREASGRLVEVRASAGDERGAREAALRYLARYPDGPHASLARRVLVGANE